MSPPATHLSIGQDGDGRVLKLFQPASIGSLTIRNRIVRGATVETMADEGGEVTKPLVDLHARLAKHQVGLIFTGGMYVHPRGQSTRFQTGIHSDHLVDGLSAIPEAVHQQGGHVFAQLQHSGNQSSVVEELVSPSTQANLLTGRRPLHEASSDEIWEVIRAFALAARRAVSAGYDGVHIHGANGYLISSFSSPYANRRSDGWGGTPEKRGRFIREVVIAVRAAVPSGFPVTLKLGVADAVADGLPVDEGVERARSLAELGLDAIEVSVNLMSKPEDSVRKYVAVDRRRAWKDLIFEDVARDRALEAYFSSYSAALRRGSVNTKIILVGGIRQLSAMHCLIQSGLADFVSLSRPFVREPNLVERLMDGKSVLAACTSCNLCLEHSGRYSLRCWRKPRRRLLAAGAIRMEDRLRGRQRNAR